MKTPRNLDGLIRTYLQEDPIPGRSEVPDHVYGAMRDGIRQTRRRAVIGSIGVPDMNKFMAVGAGAVAVVVIALGLALGGGGPLIGGDPNLIPSAQPSVTALTLPSDCAELEAGTYEARIGTLSVRVTVPAGWAGGGDQGALWVEDNFGEGFAPCIMGGASKVEVALVDRVYSDGCTRQDIIETDTPAELTAALAAQTGHQTSGPIVTTLGGHPASRFEFSTPEGFEDATACTGAEISGGVYLWPPSVGVASSEFHSGSTVTVWVVDVDGTALAVFADHGEADLDPIIASLRFASVEPSAPEPSAQEPSVEPSSSGDGSLPEGPFALWDAPGEVAITVTIPGPGWFGEEGAGVLGKNQSAILPGGGGLTVFQGPLYVYGDACHWSTTTPETPATTMWGMIAALEAQTSRDGGDAGQGWSIGGSLGWGVNLTVPEDAVFADCDGGQFRSWVGDPLLDTNVRSHQGPGQVDQLWVGEVHGVLVVFDVYFPGPSREVVDELWIAVDHDATTFQMP